MDYHLLLSFFPIVLILFLGLSLFALLSKLLNDRSFFLLLSVFLASPLIIGLFLYLLFFIFPGNEKIFYILAISFPIFILTLLERKNLFLTFHTIRLKWRIIAESPLDFFSKIIIAAILFGLMLVFLRTIFWPINWVDQIFYLKQAYAFAQTRSLDLFLGWGVFNDTNIFNYQMNPAIRPGLPMTFTTTFLFNNSLRAAQFFCQTIIFYYFILTLSVAYYVSWKIAKKDKLKSALVALFLMLFTFYYVYLSIEGFKELIIIPITILLLFYIANRDGFLSKFSPWIYIGISTGLMSFINYSGTLISLFIILIFILTGGISFKKIISVTKILILMAIFSGFEFFVFLNFITPNITFPSIHKKLATVNEQSDRLIPSVGAKKETVPPDNPFLMSLSYAAKNEFASYDITSLKDLYLKGKFQGIFQIQYFGLIFILFVIIVVLTFRKLVENNFIKNALFFLLVYTLVFFDPFNLNKHEHSYVLSISHKYTALLVPLIAIIIAYQLDWVEKTLKKISPKVLIAVLSSLIALDFIFLKNNPDSLFKITSALIPIINNHDYYIRALKLLNDLSLILCATLLAPLLYSYITRKKELLFFFRKTSAVTILFLFILFFFPFLFFYNSNFGLANTLKYSFTKNSTKLEKIIGWEDMYMPIRSLNELPKDKKVLFINQPIELIDIHLDLPMKSVYFSQMLPANYDITKIKEMGIGFIYARNNSKIGKNNIRDIEDIRLIKQIGQNSIYEVRF